MKIRTNEPTFRDLTVAERAARGILSETERRSPMGFRLYRRHWHTVKFSCQSCDQIMRDRGNGYCAECREYGA